MQPARKLLPSQQLLKRLFVLSRAPGEVYLPWPLGPALRNCDRTQWHWSWWQARCCWHPKTIPAGPWHGQLLVVSSIGVKKLAWLVFSSFPQPKIEQLQSKLSLDNTEEVTTLQRMENNLWAFLEGGVSKEPWAHGLALHLDGLEVTLLDGIILLSKIPM